MEQAACLKQREGRQACMRVTPPHFTGSVLLQHEQGSETLKHELRQKLLACMGSRRPVNALLACCPTSLLALQSAVTDSLADLMLQHEEGVWIAREQLREKLLPRLNDRPLTEFVLSTAPNKLTDRGAVFRQAYLWP